LTSVITLDRKRKPRCKTVDSVIVLNDEKRFEWTDDDEASDTDWPDFPKPGEKAYQKARNLSPRRKKKDNPPEKLSGHPKKKPRVE